MALPKQLVRPDDVDVNARRQSFFATREMIGQMNAEADARGCSRSRVLLDVLVRHGEQRLLELARNPRAEGEKPSAVAYLDVDVVEMIQRVAHEVDLTLSHVIQQAWLARSRLPDTARG